MLTPRSYLAVDGGGTKTIAVLVNANGEILARGKAGPSNYLKLGVKEWTHTVRLAVENAMGQLAEPPNIARAWVGTAGIETDKHAQEAHDSLCHSLDLSKDCLHVTNDAALLRAGMNGPGIVVIAGTGSVVHGYDTTCRNIKSSIQIGGLGWILGDEGSGFSIGRAAIKKVVSNQASPELCVAVLTHFSLDSREDLLTAMYSVDFCPYHPATLSRTIVSLAFDRQNTEAMDIIRDQLKILASQIMLALDGLPGAHYLVLSGGLATQKAYHTMLLNLLQENGFPSIQTHIIVDAAEHAAEALSKNQMNIATYEVEHAKGD
ncbi:hypothetical protein MPSI1_000365 [Malassezia psittaci]|uniref:N-acetyl-D-glucosamine kinase n=1 Tax=Malassezia psittaci TaxID=1821823 RepID=A0AAF0JCX0_9BASI|nr:hypothetical protein MPSI1_000365 [Malassezia psittaci]